MLVCLLVCACVLLCVRPCVRPHNVWRPRFSYKNEDNIETELPIRLYKTRNFTLCCAWMGNCLRLVMKVRACLNGAACREPYTCMCAQRHRLKVLNAEIAALNSAWGIDVCLFVVCVGRGLVTVT